MDITKARAFPSFGGWGSGELTCIESALAGALDTEEALLSERLERCECRAQREAYLRKWANLKSVLATIRSLVAAQERHYGFPGVPANYFFVEGARRLVPQELYGPDDENEGSGED